MVPLLVLAVVTLITRLVGAVAAPALDSWFDATRLGLAAMLIVTGSAHFGSRRADLVRIVPPPLPSPELLVTVTGIAELVIAVGLLVQRTAPFAAAMLIPLLVALFPANVHAARAGVPIGGRDPMPIGPRAAVQAVFIAAACAVLVG